MNSIIVKFIKHFTKNHIFNSEHEYYEALQKFIYDTGGCIATFSMEELGYNQEQIAYQCIGPFKEADADYLMKKVQELSDADPSITVVNNLDISGEVLINFSEA